MRKIIIPEKDRLIAGFLIEEEKLAEHDAKVRAEGYTEGRQDTLEEVLDGLGYADSVKECIEFVEELLEKMKEPKNESNND